MNQSRDDEDRIKQKLALASRLFRDYYAQCFWHLKPELKITEAMLPLVIKGLRQHGGRKGFLAAADLAK